MKKPPLRSFRAENFKAIRDSGRVDFGWLTVFIGNNIERIIRAPASARHFFWTNNSESRAHSGELIRNRIRIHI